MYVSVATVETWPIPNYTNPTTRGPSIMYINGILFTLVLAVVGLRTYTRLFISRSFGLDDTFILIAMLPTTAFVIIMLMAQLHYGWNRHAWDVMPDVVAIGEKMSMTSQILFAAGSTCTRLSMLFLTRRILSNGNKAFQRAITFAVVFMATDCFIFITVVIFQCRPISAYWTLSLVPQQCIDQRIHLVIQGTINILNDFCVVLIPIPTVLRLRLPLRQRIIVALLFGAGFVVCFAGIARTYYMYRVTDGYRDVTWDAYPVWLSTAVELYVGIVCTSFPPTKPFFVRYWPKLLSANSQYIQTTRDQSPTFASSRNITVKRSYSVSHDLGGRVDVEFAEFSGCVDGGKKDRWHKKCDMSQSWLDLSRTRPSSSTTSIVKLTH